MKQTIGMTIMKVSSPSQPQKIRGCLPIIHLNYQKFPDFHNVVQDEIQHYHLNKDQCTLHPVVISQGSSRKITVYINLYFIQ